jgi:hypothetical protein
VKFGMKRDNGIHKCFVWTIFLYVDNYKHGGENLIEVILYKFNIVNVLLEIMHRNGSLNCVIINM